MNEEHKRHTNRPVWIRSSDSVPTIEDCPIFITARSNDVAVVRRACVPTDDEILAGFYWSPAPAFPDPDKDDLVDVAFKEWTLRTLKSGEKAAFIAGVVYGRKTAIPHE